MKVIEHYCYAHAVRALLREIDNFRPGHMIFIIGPSGVGKTTLRHVAMREAFGRPTMWGPGRIPVIETFALLHNSAYFSSRALVASFIHELHVPNVEWLFSGDKSTSPFESSMRGELAQHASNWDDLGRLRGTEADFWTTLERLVAARHCKFISLDQVTALLVNRRNTEPAHHTLHLMALAEKAQIMFIMTGVHAATRLWEIHSELRRRVIPIWVPPYSVRRKEDEVHFLRLLKNLSAKIKMTRADLLFRISDEILAATGGVFGEIAQLLDRASNLAKDREHDRIQLCDIRDSYYGETDLRELWKDIELFEEAMKAGDLRSRAAMIRAKWSAATVTTGESE